MLLVFAVLGRLPGRENERKKLVRGKKLRESEVIAGSGNIDVGASGASSTVVLTMPSFSGGVAVMRRRDVYAGVKGIKINVAH